jgi:phosphopantothenoylcysteine decarboxylase/phosphopantothenate--cysteine ligase
MHMTNVATRPGVTTHQHTNHPPDAHGAPDPRGPASLLITAGPTHEPIDAVRYIANRSSGRLGIALAEAAAKAGWRVRLLLGPTPRDCTDTRVEVHRFRTTAELQALLEAHLPWCDALVMAAAVADYRPAARTAPGTKLRRSGKTMTLELESTPDLLAGCAARRRPGQVLVGFALEPRAELEQSARSKLQRKAVDMIVGNPLETMDSPTIEATIYDRAGGATSTPGPIEKHAFAGWLLARISAAMPKPVSTTEPGAP